jgi:tRNA-binding EMAP/Myf-like protein
VGQDVLEKLYPKSFANIKPTKLRGITSEAMFLAASDAGRTRVELIELRRSRSPAIM